MNLGATPGELGGFNRCKQVLHAADRGRAHEDGSQCEAICWVAKKLGSQTETVRKSVRRTEVDEGRRARATRRAHGHGRCQTTVRDPTSPAPRPAQNHREHDGSVPRGQQISEDRYHVVGTHALRQLVQLPHQSATPALAVATLRGHAAPCRGAQAVGSARCRHGFLRQRPGHELMLKHPADRADPADHRGRCRVRVGPVGRRCPGRRPCCCQSR